MKTITVTLYSFNELSEDAQQAALEALHDINVDYEWYDGIQDEIADQGGRLVEFDTDRGLCKIECKDILSFSHAILDNHGECCKTWKTTSDFIEERDRIVENGKSMESLSDFDDALDEAEVEYMHSIQEDYIIMLRSEYEYRTSEEAVKETIICNKYDFTEDGKLA